MTTSFAAFRSRDDEIHWILAGEPRDLPAPTFDHDGGLRFHLPNAREAGRRRDGSVARLPVCLLTWPVVTGDPPSEAPYVRVEGGTYRVVAPSAWTRPEAVSTFPIPPAAVIPPPPEPSESERRSARAWEWIRLVGAEHVTADVDPRASGGATASRSNRTIRAGRSPRERGSLRVPRERRASSDLRARLEESSRPTARASRCPDAPGRG